MSSLAFFDYPRCALYARASGSEDPEDQLVPLRARALKENWDRVGEYVDAGHETTQRQQLLADARAGGVDVVLFSTLSRFCEEGFIATIDCLDELAACGVAWLAVVEDNSPAVGVLRSLLQLAGRKGENACPKKLLQ